MIVGVPFSDMEKHVDGEYITATREDEAVAIAAGDYLAGGSPLVFMQNSGLGNCVDIMTSLLLPYDIKVNLLISNRESPKHHYYMYKITKHLIELLEYADKTRYC